MVAEAHKRGIKTIFDVVTNHCGTAHWWAGDFPSSDWVHNGDKPLITNHGWMTQADPVNRSQRDHKMMEEGWFDYSMPDMNLENPLVFNYFCHLYCWWIEWADLDGLRVDTFPYNEKWTMARWTRSILNEYPNLNIVGECWNSVPAICAYWEGASNNRDGYSSGLPSVMDFPLQEKISQGLQAASLPGDISRGKRSSMPQPKTRPDSPVPSLQGPCDRSLKSEVPCGSCLNWR